MNKRQPRSTVDPGYPTQAGGRIPSFNSIKEEAEWWDTHDSGEYDEEFVPVELTVGPELRRNKPEVAAANPEDPLRRPCRGINARPPQGGATRVIRF